MIKSKIEKLIELRKAQDEYKEACKFFEQYIQESSLVIRCLLLIGFTFMFGMLFMSFR